MSERERFIIRYALRKCFREILGLLLIWYCGGRFMDWLPFPKATFLEEKIIRGVVGGTILVVIATCAYLLYMGVRARYRSNRFKGLLEWEKRYQTRK